MKEITFIERNEKNTSKGTRKKNIMSNGLYNYGSVTMQCLQVLDCKTRETTDDL